MSFGNWTGPSLADSMFALAGHMLAIQERLAIEVGRAETDGEGSTDPDATLVDCLGEWATTIAKAASRRCGV